MCVMSMVMDHFGDEWERRWQQWQHQPWQPYITPWTQPYVKPWTQPLQPIVPAKPSITDEEVAEFRRLLDRAREYDKRNNEPDCELEEKRDRIKKLAEELGQKIEFV